MRYTLFDYWRLFRWRLWGQATVTLHYDGDTKVCKLFWKAGRPFATRYGFRNTGPCELLPHGECKGDICARHTTWEAFIPATPVWHPLWVGCETRENVVHMQGWVEK